ncbi:MAG: ABC transporter permease [Chitinophagaceae bacterium]|nr:ABC transporter permease [Chitinophagaceae bacterium]
MLVDQIKLAWRNLFKGGYLSLLNIICLALGIGVCMLIVGFISHEFSYDRFHLHSERIFAVDAKVKIASETKTLHFMSFNTAPLVKENNKSVTAFLRVRTVPNNTLIEGNLSSGNKFYETGFIYADSNMFNFFSIPLQSGTYEKLLDRPFTMVITESIAKKYFGSSNPIGQTLIVDSMFRFEITGVCANPQSNSVVQFAFVASLQSIQAMSSYTAILKSQVVEAGGFRTYFLLDNSLAVKSIEKTLARLGDTNSGEQYFLTALKDIYLTGVEGFEKKKNLIIFTIVALLVLALAIINYITLALVRGTSRVKEIGIRKLLGADNAEIAVRFYIETTLQVLFSWIIGYLIFILLQSYFDSLLQIRIESSYFLQPLPVLCFVGLLFVTIIIASSYPSLALSMTKPNLLVQQKIGKKGRLGLFQKYLTGFQFFISIALIICTLTIREQHKFITHTDTGVARDNILMINFGKNIYKHYSAFKKSIKDLSGIQGIAAAHYPMYKGYDVFYTSPIHSKDEVALPVISVDEQFFSLMGIKWLHPPVDSNLLFRNDQIVINEAALSKLRIRGNSSNESIPIGTNNYHIAGVVRNFNFESLRYKIDGLGIFVIKDTASSWQASTTGCLFVKPGKTVKMTELLENVRSIYLQYEQDIPFEYMFLDEAYGAMYKSEESLSKLLTIFTFVGFVIACMGLLGLTAVTVMQRAKEIAIRKVIGASTVNIIQLLSHDAVILILIAWLVAVPITWILMKRWLESFYFRIDLNFSPFVLTGIGVLIFSVVIIAIVTHRISVDNHAVTLKR